MPEYIPASDTVVFFEKVGETKYIVISEGLPFTIPEGPISMVATNINGSKRYIDQLVVGTDYELEPKPNDPEGQAAYRSKAFSVSLGPVVHLFTRPYRP